MKVQIKPIQPIRAYKTAEWEAAKPEDCVFLHMSYNDRQFVRYVDGYVKLRKAFMIAGKPHEVKSAVHVRWLCDGRCFVLDECDLKRIRYRKHDIHFVAEG